MATRQNKWYTSLASDGVKKARDETHGDLKGSGILRERERYRNGIGGGIQMKRLVRDGSENMMETYSLHDRG